MNPYHPLIQHKWFKGWIVWNWESASWEAIDKPKEKS